MPVLVATNARGRAHCMKFSVTHQVDGHGHEAVGLVDDVFGTTVQGKGAHMLGAKVLRHDPSTIPMVRTLSDKHGRTSAIVRKALHR